MKYPKFSNVLAIVSLFLIGCSDNLNVPLWEKLPDDVISLYAEQDSNFLDFVSECEWVANWIIDNEDASNKYKDVTYSQVYKWEKHGYEYYEKNKNRLEEEFLKANPIFKEREKKFNEYLEEYKKIQPDSVIRITFIDKEIDDTPWKRNVALTFEIVPLKGTLRDLNFTCTFIDKASTEEVSKSQNEVFFEVNDKITDKYIFKSRIEGHIFDDLIIDAIYDLSYDDIVANYNVDIDAWQYKVNGQSSSDFPFASQYLDAKDETAKDNSYERIFENLFGKDMMTPVRYAKDKCNEECIRFDPKVSEMFLDFVGVLLF